MKTPSLRVAALVLAVSSVALAQPAAPPDQFFDSNGVRIRYVEQGTGAPVVMLHGYTGTLDRHFIANGVFAAIARDHRAIAMDLRAHGKSGKPHDPKAYGDELAKDVVRLLDHLKIQKAHDVKALAAMWRGGAFLVTSDRALTAARFPMIEIVGTLDPSVSDVAPLRTAHPQIKTLVLEGATHGGEQGVLRRPETMTALRDLWAGSR